jgi:peptidyl-prolyl cis-trans isomerase C
LLDTLKKLAREPLCQFLLIGAGIYLLYALSAGREVQDDPRVIVVSAGEIQALSDQWRSAWKRPPTSDELAGVIRDHVRTRILFREAEAMELDQGDIVIQRRLAQKVELLAQSLVMPEEPSEETLKAWFATNADQFAQADRYTVTHIFFDPDKREDTTLDDAAAVLAELNSLAELPDTYTDYGDRFMLQNYYPDRTELELRKLFGAGFVQQVTTLEAGTWQGPVLSGYGTHLVLVNEVKRSPKPEYEAIQEQVRQQWMASQVEELSQRFINSIIERYEIVVEDTEVPLTVPNSGSTS